MEKKIIEKTCNRIFSLKEFFKLYYSVNENNEFRIWLDYHDAGNEVNTFYDKLHEIMSDDFTPALMDLFINKPEQMKKVLLKQKALASFIEKRLFVLEIFKQEWEKYINQEDDEYVSILLTPDNDVNDLLNDNSDDNKIIKFHRKNEKPEDSNDD